VRRRAVVVLVLLVLLAGGVALAAFLVWKHRHPGTIRGSGSTEFVSTEEPGGTTRSETAVRDVPWPTYGYDNARTRFAPEYHLRPPFRRLWTAPAYTLLEFPPVIAYGRLYVANLRGRLIAVDAKTGHVVWAKQLGRCTAASPAVGGGVVYQTLMDPSPCPQHQQNAAGYLVALDAATGKELWRFRSGVTESPPLLVGRVVYFGSWDRKMYAVDAKTHRMRWSFTTGDKIKDGAAYASGTVYFGSYDGKVYAVDARTGKLRWSGSGVGNFYATPAVAYGRVFIGNTDGRVYAFGARSGHLLWARSTGRYVYGSAAVWNKTVYVGSYDNRFYALDAATGDVRWSFRTNGPISGAPTVLAGVVYFSSTTGRTYGLDARSGKQLWTFPDGQYTPVVADETRVYVTGENRLYGFEPRS
jgi:outer membrane protein assembly factor BamB